MFRRNTPTKERVSTGTSRRDRNPTPASAASSSAAAIGAEEISDQQQYQHEVDGSLTDPARMRSGANSCSGRCLCLCQCHGFTREDVPSSVSATQTQVNAKKPKSSFIGTLKKKLTSIRKKDNDESEFACSFPTSPSTAKSRSSSSERVLSVNASHSRTLPRSWKAVNSSTSGERSPTGTTTSGCTTEKCNGTATPGRPSFCKRRSEREQSFFSMTLSPMKPRRSDRLGKEHSLGGKVGVGRPSETLKTPMRLSDDDAKKLLVPDTGYGHASPPVNTDQLECSSSSAALGVVPQAPPFYDHVKELSTGWSLTKELFKLPKYGWYWGPISRAEAEEKLANQPDGAFLLRDSSDERYLLSLSFRSYGKTLHTRIEHCNGLFSFYAQNDSEGYSSIVDLIENSMNDSQSGVFCYSRARAAGSPSFPVRLARPVSRFTQVRSLQYLCRFVIRQHTRVDYIQKLPLPPSIKGWLEETQY